MQSGKVKAAGLVQGNSEAPAPLVESAQGSLRTIVREALLNVLKDQDASAAAKASAGRTLLQFFTDESPQSRRRGADMTAAELDAALAQLGE